MSKYKIIKFSDKDFNIGEQFSIDIFLNDLYTRNLGWQYNDFKHNISIYKHRNIMLIENVCNRLFFKVENSNYIFGCDERFFRYLLGDITIINKYEIFDNQQYVPLTLTNNLINNINKEINLFIYVGTYIKNFKSYDFIDSSSWLYNRTEPVRFVYHKSIDEIFY